MASGLWAWMWARQWWLIDHPPPLDGGVTVSVSPPELADPYRIERNHLARYASANALRQWITGRSYLALAVVAALLGAWSCN